MPHRSRKISAVTVLLICVLVPLYTSVEISLFIVDQYIYYRYSTDAGLSYGPEENRNSCINTEAGDSDKEKRIWVQEKTAYVTSVNNFLGMATGTLATLFMGYASDRFGRRLVLLWIMLSEALRISSGALIMMFDWNPWAMVVPNLFEGALCGGLLSAIAQISVCAVDLTKHQERSLDPNHRAKSEKHCWLLLTFFDATAALCLAIGKAIGGFLVYHRGFTITALVNLIVFAPGVIAVYFLPETNSSLIATSNAEQTEPANLTDPNILGGRTEGLRLEFKTSLKFDRIRRKIRLWCSEVKKVLCGTLHPASLTAISILFLFSIAAMVDIHYGFLYLMGPPFCWNSSAVGLYSGFADACSAIVSVLLVILTVCFGLQLGKRRGLESTDEVLHEPTPSDREPCITPDSVPGKHLTQHQKLLVLFLAGGLALILLSKIVMGIAYLFPLPTANNIVYLALVLKITKSINIPVIRALLASWLPNTQQGRVFALAALSERIGLLISVSTLQLIYAATLKTCPATVFMLCAALLGLGLILTGFLPIISSNVPELRSGVDERGDAGSLQNRIELPEEMCTQ